MTGDNKLTFIDLFAGCGGLSEGFLQSGRYEALAHVEWEMPMVNTLRNRLITRWNHSEDEALRRVVHYDIQQTDSLVKGSWSENDKYIKSNHPDIVSNGLKGLIGNQKVDLIIGGPPCQAYSIAGRAQDKDSMQFDYRNYLFESFVKVVDAFRPSVFVFENVPGMLSACPGQIPVTGRIFDAFESVGYIVRKPEKQKLSVYSASEFGVPQKRNRVILIGTRKDSGLTPEDFYSEIDTIINKNNVITVRDAIGNLPVFTPLETPVKVNGENISHKPVSQVSLKHHSPRYHNPRDIQIFREWIHMGMNEKSSEEKMSFYNSLMNKNSNHIKYRNLDWDRPSPTIVAHLYKDGLMFIHPDKKQARSITVKEAALLQSFPDDFDFIGSQGYAFKMIGNAVPPRMAEMISIAIARKLLNYGE